MIVNYLPAVAAVATLAIAPIGFLSLAAVALYMVADFIGGNK